VNSGGTLLSTVAVEPTPAFEDHPGLRGRQAEARELADVLRRLIRLSVSTAPSAAETVQLTAQLTEVADRMETHVPRLPLPRFTAPAEDGPPREPPLGSFMPFDLIVGEFNPLAVPVRLDFDPPRALGYATFDVGYEGAPGCVHGAALAATFDIILTAANAIGGATGPTVRLQVHYRRPTLVGEEAVFEGWVTEVTERRIFSQGRIVQGGEVTVEAEGEFAVFRHGGVDRMAAARRQAFDATATDAAP
jgi:acyl-CoA thioesterase FadM